jgi:hypothetical protein
LTGSRILLQLVEVFFTGVYNVCKGDRVANLLRRDETPVRFVKINVAVGVFAEIPATGRGDITMDPSLRKYSCRQEKTFYYLEASLSLYRTVEIKSNRDSMGSREVGSEL